MQNMNKDNTVEILTGVRPTGDLTIANYLGAIKPIIEILDKGLQLYVFVADLHALTDNEPDVVKKYINEVVADYIALGLDPEKVVLYTQSDIAEEIALLTTYLSRLTTVAELMRVPTLKDKLKAGAGPESANALLLLYPVMMAADILIQRSEQIPVGKDQVAHIEMSRLLADRFNKRYGDVFPVPKIYQVDALSIVSLTGKGKMSKSSPEGALFLTDSPKKIAKKIKKAQTAVEGEMSEVLESHIMIAKGICNDQDKLKQLDGIIEAHKAGQQVMGDFKKLLTDLAQDFVAKFQEKRKEVVKDPNYIPGILSEGAKIASENAKKTLTMVQKAMFKE